MMASVSVRVSSNGLDDVEKRKKQGMRQMKQISRNIGKKHQPPTIFGAALITRPLSPSVFSSSNEDTLSLSLICYAIVLTCLILSNDKIDKMLRWKFETTTTTQRWWTTKRGILMSENREIPHGNEFFRLKSKTARISSMTNSNIETKKKHKRARLSESVKEKDGKWRNCRVNHILSRTLLHPSSIDVVCVFFLR